MATKRTKAELLERLAELESTQTKAVTIRVPVVVHEMIVDEVHERKKNPNSPVRSIQDAYTQAAKQWIGVDED